MKVFTSRFTPADAFCQIGGQAYEKFFHQKTIRDFYETYHPREYEDFGELDTYSIVQLMRGKSTVTTGTINLQQNSFSQRGWFVLPEDTYKGNGRIRHERINIQVSHFLNIQVHSYQSGAPAMGRMEPGSVGSEDHFDIYIFRNSKLVGGEHFTKIPLGGSMKEKNGQDAYYLGHNEQAREEIFLHFLEGGDDESELEHHDLTNKLLAGMYASIALGNKGENAQVVMGV